MVVVGVAVVVGGGEAMATAMVVVVVATAMVVVVEVVVGGGVAMAVVVALALVVLVEVIVGGGEAMATALVVVVVVVAVVVGGGEAMALLVAVVVGVVMVDGGEGRGIDEAAAAAASEGGAPKDSVAIGAPMSSGAAVKSDAARSSRKMRSKSGEESNMVSLALLSVGSGDAKRMRPPSSGTGDVKPRRKMSSSSQGDAYGDARSEMRAGISPMAPSTSISGESGNWNVLDMSLSVEKSVKSVFFLSCMHMSTRCGLGRGTGVSSSYFHRRNVR